MSNTQMETYRQNGKGAVLETAQAPRAHALGVKKGNAGLQLETMADILEFARIIHESGLAPRGLDTPQKVFVAINMGAELGLSPMSAIQNIGVINGKPGIYGSIALGLVRASGKLAEINEWLEDEKGNELASWPQKPDQNTRAVCSTRRSDSQTPVVTSFSWGDAMKAGLSGKQGPWSQYPARMMMFRARGFNLADNFPEILKGVKTTEELEDYPAEAAHIQSQGKPDSLAARIRAGAVKVGAVAEGAPEPTSEPASEPAPVAEPELSADELDHYDARRALAAELGLKPTGKLKADSTRATYSQRLALINKMIEEQQALNRESFNNKSGATLDSEPRETPPETRADLAAEYEDTSDPFGD